MNLKSIIVRNFFMSFALIAAFLGQASYASNGISFVSRPDIANGGTHFDMSFDSLSNPALIHPTWVSVSTGGNYFIFDSNGAQATRILCNTTSCTFYVPGLRAVGTYDLEFNVNAPEQFSFQDTADVTEISPAWWNSMRQVSYFKDIFSGTMSISFRFTNVPASITSLNLDIFTDLTWSGIYSNNGSIACVNEGSGSFLCTFASLPPLCIEENGTCCDGNYAYYFGLNFALVLTGGYDATHRNLTQYQEGNYFGNFNYDQGMNLQDRLNLDTYVFENPTACFYESPEPYHCWNVAYYIRWTQRYLNDFENHMRGNGRFIVKKQGSDTYVAMTVPRLPVGTRGYGVKLAYYPDSNPSNVTEVSMDCSVNSCVPVILNGINPDNYQFELRLYNNHPVISYEDFNLGQEVFFGGELYKTIKFTEVKSRKIFYNRSSSTVFGDGSGNPVNAIDDSKTALLAGRTSSSDNYTNYIKGLNGIIIDIKGTVGNITASDLQFASWNGITLNSFTPVSVIPTVTKFQLNNSVTRIKIEFDDYAIRNTWLRITVLANARTGLLKNDQFYFGHAAADVYKGNVGNPITVRVNATDTATIRQNQSISPNSVPITNRYDLNKDGRVNAIDTALCRQNQQSSVIRYFNAPIILFGLTPL